MTTTRFRPDIGPPTLERIRRAPKVLLHDHLDGGLRPATIIELADETGYTALPTTDADELAAWMLRGANRKDLTLYLETFAHTVGVMQTAPAIERVARECAEDLAADGVVYAEIRFAPELHTERGLSLDEVIEAVLAGFRAGSAGTDLMIRVICSAIRHLDNGLEIARAAVRYRDDGVVGFDIAGPEDGFPPDDHLLAFQYCHRENFHVTIHAGEAYGPRSIWKAVQFCGAERLGHGIRIVEDWERTDDGETQLGRLSHYLRDARIPLEVCPTSNVNGTRASDGAARAQPARHRARSPSRATADSRPGRRHLRTRRTRPPGRRAHQQRGYEVGQSQWRVRSLAHNRCHCCYSNSEAVAPRLFAFSDTMRWVASS